MLKEIKSSIITKIIFNKVNDKIKLKIIEYNKTIQEKINIGIKFLILFSFTKNIYFFMYNFIKSKIHCFQRF